MKQISRFTLIELLIVVGIIALLAGLITPAVITAQQKGRITQAKSDMHTILMALKGLESTYHRMVTNSGSASSPEYKYAAENDHKAKALEKTVNGVEYQYAAFGAEKDASGADIKVDGESIGDDAQNAYDALIVELSDPKNKGFSDASHLNTNKRRQIFLDPKPEYDPSKEFGNSDFTTANAAHLWLDPWGNRYVILINTNSTNAIPNPADTGKLLSAQAVAVSCGPNGTWDNGKNAEVNVGSPAASDDDVASWH